MTTKTKIRARKMWATREAMVANKSGHMVWARPDPFGVGGLTGNSPVFVIPADDASVEAMVEQAHDAVLNEFTSKRGKPGLKDYSDAVLASLGLTPPTRNKGTRPKKKL